MAVPAAGWKGDEPLDFCSATLYTQSANVSLLVYLDSDALATLSPSDFALGGPGTITSVTKVQF